MLKEIKDKLEIIFTRNHKKCPRRFENVVKELIETTTIQNFHSEYDFNSRLHITKGNS